jgi:large subunit ribosomal protein L33
MDIIHSATRKQDTKFKARLRKGRNELEQVGKAGPGKQDCEGNRAGFLHILVYVCCRKPFKYIFGFFNEPRWQRKVKPGETVASSLRNRFILTSYRTIIVRMISTAQTGFFYTTQRLRQGPRLSAVKYDPKGMGLAVSGDIKLKVFFSQAARLVRRE